MATQRQHWQYELPEADELSHDDACALFDDHARTYLSMSGEEFLRRWDAGEIDDPDQSDIVRQVLMIPLLGRPIVLAERE